MRIIKMFNKIFNSSTLVLSIICLSQFVRGVDCIQCYQCDSLIDDVRGCSVSPPSVEYLQNCSSAHPVTNEQYNEDEIWCRKIRNHRIPMIPGHRRSVIRECAYIHWDREICYKAKWQVVCECNRNACNGVTLPFESYGTYLLLYLTPLSVSILLY